MLTPQEIKEKKFSKAVFGGYDMSEVDDFLDSILSDYSTLYKESVVLKGKLKVLVETVEEYRSVDASMRKALLAAQKMASEMTEEAKQKSTEMLSKVETEAKERIEGIRIEIQREETRLEAAKRKTSSFIDGMVTFCRQQMEVYQNIDSMPEKSVRETHMEEAANDIAHSVVSLFRDEAETQPIPVEPVPAQPIPVQLMPEQYVSEMLEQSAPYAPPGSNPDSFLIFNGDKDYHGLTPSSEASQTGPGFPPDFDDSQTIGNPRSIQVGGMNIQVFEAKFSGDDEESEENTSF